MKNWADRVNGYGVLFRFLTPALLAIVGTLILNNLNLIKEEENKTRLELTAFQKESRDYNNNHLEHHRLNELKIEQRLTKIETLLKK